MAMAAALLDALAIISALFSPWLCGLGFFFFFFFSYSSLEGQSTDTPPGVIIGIYVLVFRLNVLLPSPPPFLLVDGAAWWSALRDVGFSSFASQLFLRLQDPCAGLVLSCPIMSSELCLAPLFSDGLYDGYQLSPLFAGHDGHPPEAQGGPLPFHSELTRTPASFSLVSPSAPKNGPPILRFL